jgi:hypothetical protein
MSERERRQRTWARLAIWKGYALVIAAVSGILNHLYAASALVVVISLFLIAWGRWVLSTTGTGRDR